jgi:1-acyl-sn-glycerol-3-phosphate acyltransferase
MCHLTISQRKESILLYPGGVREGFKRKNEKYQLFWPHKPEFVRMAARFGATIVPVASIGAEDCVNILMDTEELKHHVLLGETLICEKNIEKQHFH